MFYKPIVLIFTQMVSIDSLRRLTVLNLRVTNNPSDQTKFYETLVLLSHNFGFPSRDVQISDRAWGILLTLSLSLAFETSDGLCYAY